MILGLSVQLKYLPRKQVCKTLTEFYSLERVREGSKDSKPSVAQKNIFGYAYKHYLDSNESSLLTVT